MPSRRKAQKPVERSDIRQKPSISDRSHHPKRPGDLRFAISATVQPCNIGGLRLDSSVALIGDGTFCPSLLAGEGASLAMAAAHLSAGELQKANAAAVVAFHEYQRANSGLSLKRSRALSKAIREVVCSEEPVRDLCAKFRDPVDLITAACKVGDEPYHF